MFILDMISYVLDRIFGHHDRNSFKRMIIKEGEYFKELSGKIEKNPKDEDSMRRFDQLLDKYDLDIDSLEENQTTEHEESIGVEIRNALIMAPILIVGIVAVMFGVNYYVVGMDGAILWWNDVVESLRKVLHI